MGKANGHSPLQSMWVCLISYLHSEIAAYRKVWSYNPGRHYMRGPGPKWREKHAGLRIGDRLPDPPIRIDGLDRVVSSRQS